MTRLISIKCTYKNLLNLEKLISTQNTLRVATKTGTELYFVKTKAKKPWSNITILSYQNAICESLILKKIIFSGIE